MNTTLIGPRIRAARLAAGMSQTELAARLGWKQAHVSRLEQQPDCDASTLAAVARALACSADELLGLAVSRRKSPGGIYTAGA